jgi:transcriptional regulator with XRE-family HTH domain
MAAVSNRDQSAEGDRPGENPLQALIRLRRHERGWSYGGIAARGGLSRSTVYYLATASPLVRSPSASTLERLAVGLALPVEVVRRAAAQALGLHVYVESEPEADPDLEVLIASVEQLAPEDRQHVAALVRSLLAGYQEGDPDLP